MDMTLKIKSLDQFVEESNPIKYPISICFTKADEIRWCELRERLRKVDNKLALSEFARRSIISMMNDVEKLIEQHEANKRGA